MKIDLQLFRDILSFDSTSGSEEGLADFLLSADIWSQKESNGQQGPNVKSWPVPEGGRNILFSWGTPRVVFCTHLDTVPPYIPPTLVPEGGTLEGGTAEGGTPPGGSSSPESAICGRGACDAKGQIISMISACRALAAEGLEGFGLLLVSGEETGSWGAKAFSKTGFSAPYLIVGEPTENKMVSASKGTKAFELTFSGEAFHSGYPQWGSSAVDAFVNFVNKLRAVDFGQDPELGPTTWNIGRLVSDNPQNVLSPSLSCRLYFRTTFLSDDKVADVVERLMKEVQKSSSGILAIGGDTPAHYLTLPGFESAPVAFGSDAPHLTGFEHKIICGPGSIRYAHRDDERISLAELEKAADQYAAMFKALGSK